MGGEYSRVGRFAEPELLILVSLAGGEKHGYAIMEDIKHGSDVRVGPGTLYTALSRLESQGLIEPLPTQDRRRPYRLTAAGTSALRAQLTDLHQFAQLGLQRLAEP